MIVSYIRQDVTLPQKGRSPLCDELGLLKISCPVLLVLGGISLLLLAPIEPRPLIENPERICMGRTSPAVYAQVFR